MLRVMFIGRGPAESRQANRHHEAASRENAMIEVSAFRLALMRVGYIVLAGGLGYSIWPGLIHHEDWTSSRAVASCLLAALSLLAAFGIRYPLQMLPVLLFELVWKAIWLIAIALPRWFAHEMDPATWQMVITCLAAVVIVPLLIPWPYVFANYVVKRGERWR